MLAYNKTLKTYSTQLRTRMTASEVKLWMHLKGKQLLNIQFYRQKPIGRYIVDFYAPSAQLVIEVDGNSHFLDEGKKLDIQRDYYLRSQGLEVLRFDNLQVLRQTEGVMKVIYQTVKSRLEKIPLPPFSKGEF